QARPEPFRAAEPNETAFPAIRYKLTASGPVMEGAMPEKWVAMSRGYQVSRLPSGTGFVEALGANCPPALLEEFRHPPAEKQLGKKGQVVIFFRGETLRLDVDQHLGGPSQPLGKAGWTVHVKDFSADADPHAKGAVPSFPIVFLELSRAGGGEPVQVAA